jgi:magnesium chelatase family protein
LRQPLEEEEVWISRARQRCRFPCQITLVAATNPCPCGWWGDSDRPCRCGEAERRRYWGRLSGPLLDRMDLQVVMQRSSPHELGEAFRIPSHAEVPAHGGAAEPAPEASHTVAERVLAARHRMAARNPEGCGNGRLPVSSLAQCLHLADGALEIWERALARRHLSARSGARLLRVARTISDLAQEARVGPAAIAEALTYRSFDGMGQGSDARLNGSGGGDGPGRAGRQPEEAGGPLPREDCRRHG